MEIDEKTGTALIEREALHVCVFQRGSSAFGVPVATVNRIWTVDALTKVPAAPEFVCGAVNLLGNVVPVISVDRWLSVEPVASAGKSTILVLETKFDFVGVLVDRVLTVGELLTAVSGEEIQGEGSVVYAAGLCEFRDSLVMLLDVDRLIEDCQKQVRFLDR